MSLMISPYDNVHLPISTITLMEVGGNTNPTQTATAYLYTNLGD